MCDTMCTATQNRHENVLTVRTMVWEEVSGDDEGGVRNNDSSSGCVGDCCGGDDKNIQSNGLSDNVDGARARSDNERSCAGVYS